jgi:hypothetical protein
MDIYNKIQAIQNIGDRRKALKELSASDKKTYEKYQTNLRQKKYMANAENKDKVYANKREYKREYRKKNPEKTREIVRGYVQRFRERLKKKEATNIASDILGDIINNTFTTVDRKKRAQYMREYRARKKA